MLHAVDQVWDEPVDEFETPPVHRLVSAADCKLLSTKGFTSVWEFAQRPDGRFRAAPWWTEPRHIISRIERHESDGITRHVTMREQETKEWAEKEERRRARQRPPRPTKQRFKLRGTKFMDGVAV